MVVTGVREQFPALAARPAVAYLDSATTTLKPVRVVEAVSRYLSMDTASVGRGGHPWSTRLTTRVAGVRQRVARFIGAGDADEVVFTPGATAGLNAVALCWGLPNLRSGDEVLLCLDDHASAVYPWLHLRQVLDRVGVRITLVPYPLTAGGRIDVDGVLAKVSGRTRLLVVTQVHPVFGVPNPVEMLHRRLDPAVVRCVDASQSVGHLPVDVDRLGADFLVFAAHKMFGAPGTGVLYCRRRVHDRLDPFLPGGSGDSAGPSTTEPAAPGGGGLAMPWRLEGGTPNIPGIVALDAALDLVEEVGVERIDAHVRRLTGLLVAGLAGLPRVRVLGGAGGTAGIVSFRVEGCACADVGFVLADRDVYVRAGSLCLAGRGPGDSVRASVHVYSGDRDVARLVEGVELIAKGVV